MKIKSTVLLLLLFLGIGCYHFFSVNQLISFYSDRLHKNLISFFDVGFDISSAQKNIEDCLSVDSDELWRIDIYLDLPFFMNYSDRMRLQNYSLCLNRLNRTNVYFQMKARYSELSDILLRNYFYPTFNGVKKEPVRHPKMDAAFYASGLYPFSDLKLLKGLQPSNLCSGLSTRKSSELLYICATIYSNQLLNCFNYKNISEIKERIETSDFCRSQM